MEQDLKPEERYILHESPEISIGEDRHWAARIAAAFPAFQSRNYQLYFFGQLFSLIGTWLQLVAEGWLVLQLTNSVFLIGLIAALSTLPSLFLTLFGGVIVDRFSKKKILMFTQSASMILALTLGVLTVFEVITIWHIGILAFLLGIVTAIDSPARQAFVTELVTRQQLPSAISLNSGIFNAARVVGPSIAGLLIAGLGTGAAFLVNGASYIAVLAALMVIRVQEKPPGPRIHVLKAIREGIMYSFSHPIIRTLMVLTAVISVFGWSYSTIMPVLARDTFGLGASGLGYLYAATGLGALLATVVISAWGNRIRPHIFILGGNTIFSLSLFFFTYTTQLRWALPLLFTAGFGLVSQFAMINTSIQQLVRDELRGRVMSIYILMFLGLTPLGNFQIGWVSSHMGPDFAIRAGAILVLLAGMLILFYRKRIGRAYEHYKSKALPDAQPAAGSPNADASSS